MVLCEAVQIYVVTATVYTVSCSNTHQAQILIWAEGGREHHVHQTEEPEKRGKACKNVGRQRTLATALLGANKTQGKNAFL